MSELEEKKPETTEDLINNTIKSFLPEGADPAELVKVRSTLPSKRNLIIDRPGNINYASDKGSFPGCRIVEFRANGDVHGLDREDFDKYAEQWRQGGSSMSPVSNMNLYFAHRANLIVTNIYVQADGSITCLFTNQLEGSTIELFTAFSRAWEACEAAIKEKIEADEQAEKDKEKARKEAEAADLALGKKVREQNLIGKLREVSDKLESLQKENNRLKSLVGEKAPKKGKA